MRQIATLVIVLSFALGFAQQLPNDFGDPWNMCQYVADTANHYSTIIVYSPEMAMWQRTEEDFRNFVQNVVALYGGVPPTPINAGAVIGGEAVWLGMPDGSIGAFFWQRQWWVGDGQYPRLLCFMRITPLERQESM